MLTAHDLDGLARSVRTWLRDGHDEDWIVRRLRRKHGQIPGKTFRRWIRWFLG